MTNAIPTFINSLFPFMTKNSKDAARDAIETARAAFAAAEEETKFGEIARHNADRETGKTDKNMMEIAVWHYERGMKKYFQAFAKFEKAARLNLPPKYKKYIERKMHECLQQSNFINAQKRNTEKKR